MRTLKNRALAFVVTTLTMLGLSLGMGIRPASAAVVNGCDAPSGQSGAVCLYNWVDWLKGGGFWRRSFTQMLNYADGGQANCASLNHHYWDIGGLVYDEPPSSMVINKNTNSGATSKVRMYDWVDCNYAGGYVEFYIGGDSALSQDNHLGTTNASANFYTSNTNWYDRVSSIQLCTVGTC